MSEPAKSHATARCSCGSVELNVIGAAITSVACYCDDCQQGSRMIDELPNAPPVLEVDSGTAYVLYRKDRVECVKGAQFLKSYKINDQSATNRAVATCCNSAMYMSFDDGRHWVPVYRARLRGDAPSLQMRIQTKFKSGNSDIPKDVPSYSGYPLRFLAKLIAAWIPMLLHR